MCPKRSILLATVNIIFVISATSGSDCRASDPPEASCAVSNGYQMVCVCFPFGGGCWCSCPPEADRIDGVCQPKPTKIGERCIGLDSCSEITGAFCNLTATTCQCNQNTHPANNLEYCISPPTILDDKCSDFAPCEPTIVGSECQNVNNEFQCKCVPDTFPNGNRNACFSIPKKIGDNCSQYNPCSEIPSAVCVYNAEKIEPTCQCPAHYTDDGVRCLPTRIGLKCSYGSPCEIIERASCFGTPDVAICLCLWNIPNDSLTECLEFELNKST